jgi:hypothetical protein
MATPGGSNEPADETDAGVELPSDRLSPARTALTVAACLVIAASFFFPWILQVRIDLATGRWYLLNELHVWDFGCPFYFLGLPLALLIAAFSPALRRPSRVAPLRTVVFASLCGALMTVAYSVGLLVANSLNNLTFVGFFRPTGAPLSQPQTGLVPGAGGWMSLGGYLGVLVVNLLVRGPHLLAHRRDIQHRLS